MKATAWPALAVALALVAARCGRRAAATLVLVTLCVPLAVDGPVLFAQPASVVSNTILFPLGLTKIKSPAATPLPGHLMAEAWPWGHYAAIGLILLAGLAIAVWLVVAPPRDERAAGWRLVIGVTLMFAFAPASRFGYIVYPLGLAAWLLLSGLPSRGGSAPSRLLDAAALRRASLGRFVAHNDDHDCRVLDHPARCRRRSRQLRGRRGPGGPGQRAAKPHRRHVHHRRG